MTCVCAGFIDSARLGITLFGARCVLLSGVRVGANGSERLGSRCVIGAGAPAPPAQPSPAPSTRLHSLKRHYSATVVLMARRIWKTRPEEIRTITATLGSNTLTGSAATRMYHARCEDTPMLETITLSQLSIKIKYFHSPTLLLVLVWYNNIFREFWIETRS